MDLKKLVVSAVLGTSLVFVGCGDDDGIADGGATDTGTGDDVETMADAPMAMPLEGACASGDCFFVADVVDTPSAESGVTDVAGSNLDGEVTAMGDLTGCGKQDYTNPRNGETGIDNALSALVPVIEGAASINIAEQLETSIAEGSLLLLMKLTGAESTEDDSVMGSLFLGAVPGDGTPTLTAGGTLEPGQTFDIDSMEIALPGAIAAGRFEASLTALPIDLPVGDMPITITIRDASLSADVTATGLANGEIAGSLSVEELTTAIQESGLGGGALPPETIANILSSAADLEPDGDGICQNLSVGLTFNGIEAVEGATL